MNTTDSKHIDELGKASYVIKELGFTPNDSMWSDCPDLVLPSKNNPQIGMEVVTYSTHRYEKAENALYKIIDEYIDERLDKRSAVRYEIGIFFMDLIFPTNVNYQKIKQHIFDELDNAILPNQPWMERQYIADVVMMENPGALRSCITCDKFVEYDDLNEQVLLDCIANKELKLKEYKALPKNSTIQEYYLIVFFPLNEHAEIRNYTLPESFTTEYSRIYLVDGFYINRII